MDFVHDFAREFLPNIKEVLVYFFLGGLVLTGLIMRISNKW